MPNPSMELLRGIIISKVSDCKKLSKEQLDAAIDGGFLDKYLNHPNKDIASKYRETILSGQFQDFDDNGETKKEEVKKVESTNTQTEDVAGQEPKKVETVAPQANPPKEEAKKWGEYDSPDKLYEALKAKEESEKQLREMYSKSRLAIDKHNADAGLLSEQLRQEREERERVAKELDESRKKLGEFEGAKKPVDLVAPDVPQDVSELTDPNSTYWQKHKSYNKAVNEAVGLSAKERLEYLKEKRILEDKINELMAGFKDIKEEKKQRISNEVKSRYTKALNDLYSDIADAQSKNSELATSISFKTINEGVLAGGEKYLNTVPQSDVEKFKLLTSLVSNGYGTFINEVDGENNHWPIFNKNQAFDNFNQRYLLQLEKTGELAKRFKDREKVGAEQATNALTAPSSRGTAVTIPSGFAGGAPTDVSQLSADEESKELNRLLALQDARKLSASDELRLDQILFKNKLFGAIPKKNLERLMANQK